MQTAPVSPREPPTTSTWPESNLVEFGRPRRGEVEDAVARSRRRRARPAPRRESRSRPPEAPRRAPCPGAIQCPSLAAWKLTVTSASTAPPLHLARGRIHARCDVGRHDGGAAAVDRLDRGVRRGARRSREPGAEDRVHDHAGALERRRRSRRGRPRGGAVEPLQVRRRVGRELVRRATAAAPRPRSRCSARWRAATSPSPPLLPLPQTTRAGPPDATGAAASATAAPAVSISSSDGTRCSSIAQASAARIPVGVVDGLEPGFHRAQRNRLVAGRSSPRPVLLAAAHRQDRRRGELPRVRERDLRARRRAGRPTQRRDRAAAAAAPRRSPPVTSISRSGSAPPPSALSAASLAAKRAARWRPGRCCERAYASSPSVNSRSASRGRRSSARSSASDLEQIDARRTSHAPLRTWAYSTVTVFARLRGWSTFSPLSRATW